MKTKYDRIANVYYDLTAITVVTKTPINPRVSCIYVTNWYEGKQVIPAHERELKYAIVK